MNGAQLPKPLLCSSSENALTATQMVEKEFVDATTKGTLFMTITEAFIVEL